MEVGSQFTLPLNSKEYEVYEEVGAGVTSRVFRCRSRDDEIVIKAMSHAETAMNEVQMLVFLGLKWEKEKEKEECHFTPLEGWFVDDPSRLYCLAFAPSYVSLSRLLSHRRRGNGGFHVPWEKKEMARLVRHLLCGLSFLHKHGVVHGDIKPHNILVSTSEGDMNRNLDSVDVIYRLADFGNSQFASGIEAGLECTTMAYRPPEAHQGRAWGMPADLWSVGCTLYEIMTGYRFAAGVDLTISLGDRFSSSSCICSSHVACPQHGASCAELLQLLTCLLQIDPAERLGAAPILESCEFLRCR
jgi:serine/threonine protein kinase